MFSNRDCIICRYIIFCAQARDEMQAQAAMATSSGDEKPGAWKWAIRKSIWDRLENEKIAANPRPVHHRIPNFVGADKAADQVRL